MPWPCGEIDLMSLASVGLIEVSSTYFLEAHPPDKPPDPVSLLGFHHSPFHPPSGLSS